MKRKDVIGKEVAKMGLCKDCKYFTEVSRPNCTGFDDEPIFKGKKIGVCSCSKFVYLWSDRYNKYFSGEEYEELVIEDDMLTYEDYEGYYASFNVGENFGCIHFKERENG